MGPLGLALIGGGLGLAKGELIDKPQEKRDRETAAAITRWSPWTGMQAPGIQKANSLGSAMQGGMTGASLGQGMAQNDAYQAYLMRLGMGGGQTGVVAAPPGSNAWAGMTA